MLWCYRLCGEPDSEDFLCKRHDWRGTGGKGVTWVDRQTDRFESFFWPKPKEKYEVMRLVGGLEERLDTHGPPTTAARG